MMGMPQGKLTGESFAIQSHSAYFFSSIINVLLEHVQGVQVNACTAHVYRVHVYM